METKVTRTQSSSPTRTTDLLIFLVGEDEDEPKEEQKPKGGSAAGAVGATVGATVGAIGGVTKLLPFRKGTPTPT